MRWSVEWRFLTVLVCLSLLAGCRACQCGSTEEVAEEAVEEAAKETAEETDLTASEQVKRSEGEAQEAEEKPPGKVVRHRTIDFSGRPVVKLSEEDKKSNAPRATLKAMKILSDRQQAEKRARGEVPTRKEPFKFPEENAPKVGQPH